MEIYKNTEGTDCVRWTDAEGTHSMLKSTYDEMMAQSETAPL
jgi:hypothetical protein